MDILTVRESIVLAFAALAGLALVFMDERKRRREDKGTYHPKNGG